MGTWLESLRVDNQAKPLVVDMTKGRAEVTITKVDSNYVEIRTRYYIGATELPAKDVKTVFWPGQQGTYLKLDLEGVQIKLV